MIISRTLLVVLLLVCAGAALAQSPDTAQVPRLKSSAIVTRDVVRIGDLVDNTGNLADVAIFRSPDLGGTGMVSAAKVLDALRENNLLVVDTAGVDQIEVTRASRAINRKEIEQRIASAFSGQYGLGDADKLALTFEREPSTLYVDASAPGELRVVRASYDQRTTRFDITLGLPRAMDAPQNGWRYTGTLVEMVPAVVATRPLNRGETFKALDFSVEKRPKAEVPGDAITTADGVLGYSARQSLRPGVPLRQADVAKPELIKRDEFVTLFYEVPGITITVRGKALEAGAEGDVVSVLNVQSKRTVQGVVSGPGRVTIAPTGTAAVIDTADAEPRTPSRKTE